MPSLGDVANDVLARLDDIKSNLDTIKSSTSAMEGDVGAIKIITAATVSQIVQLDTDLKTGFSNVAQGLQVLIALGIQQGQLLEENNRQNDTTVCWLTNIANTLCDVKYNTDKEVQLQTDLSHLLHHIDDMAELAYAREAIEVAKRYELEHRMDECHPPEQEPPQPCFEACQSPTRVRFDPVKTDWQPVRYGQPDRPK